MNNARQYLQINLGNIGRVTGIATQGRRDAHQWVTRYMLSYGDGTKFVAYRERNKVRVSFFFFVPLRSIVLAIFSTVFVFYKGPRQMIAVISLFLL